MRSWTVAAAAAQEGGVPIGFFCCGVALLKSFQIWGMLVVTFWSRRNGKCVWDADDSIAPGVCVCVLANPLGGGASRCSSECRTNNLV